MLSPISVPTKTVGDPSFTVTLNYTANPSVSFVEWRRNGVLIINDSHIQPWTDTLKFLSLAPADNGSYSVTLYNEAGNTTIPFDIVVYCEQYSTVEGIDTCSIQYTYMCLGLCICLFVWVGGLVIIFKLLWWCVSLLYTD